MDRTYYIELGQRCRGPRSCDPGNMNFAVSRGQMYSLRGMLFEDTVFLCSLASPINRFPENTAPVNFGNVVVSPTLFTPQELFHTLYSRDWPPAP